MSDNEQQQPQSPETPLSEQPVVTESAAAAGFTDPVAQDGSAVVDAGSPANPGVVDLTGVTGAAAVGTLSAVDAAPAAAPAPAPVEANPVAIPRAAFQAALTNLDKLEREALFWGGDVGVVLRNLVCETRLHLTGDSHSPAQGALEG